MEASEEILLSTLRSFGVSVPEKVSSFKDLTPTTLISICFQSLDLLGINTKDDDANANHLSSPISVEPSLSMADKCKICSHISSAFKNLGYVGDINYYKFLYPSEEDLHKLLRFLVERLSGSSEAGNFSGKSNAALGEKNNEDQKPDHEEVDQYLEKVEAILKDLRVDELLETSSFKTNDVNVNDPLSVHDIPPNELLFNESTAEVVESEFVVSESQEATDQKADEHVSTSPGEQYSDSEEKVLKEELQAVTLQVQHLEQDIRLWKAAADLAFDESHPLAFYLKQLNERVDATKHNIQELESQWDAFRKPLESEKRNLEECLYANNPESLEKLQKLREIELEMQFTSSEIIKREEEHSKLVADLKRQPKVASRRSYVDRIKEITKNSWKLDADIVRILRETRELQLESNSIQESLHRTYTVVDETVFRHEITAIASREAKKDTVGQQAYRLLTSTHDSFEQISEKILATDRIRREMADCEKKLAAIPSRSINVDKLQADLDNMVKENEYLEQQLMEN